jgi:hypothetical protein
MRDVSIVGALLFCVMADCQGRTAGRQGDRIRPAQTNACVTESGGLIASCSCRVIRTIDDPTTRQHWLLVRNVDRPEAPAQLVQVSTRFHTSIGQSKPRISSLPGNPVIRPGDRLIVSESTAVSEGRFEATALNAAAAGESLTVRFRFGGSILHALAIAPGRATLIRNDLGQASED